MGRRSHKRIIAIISVFDKSKIILELDKEEIIIDKNKLENLRIASKYHKIKEKEKHRKLMKENKSKMQLSSKSTNKTTLIFKKSATFDDIFNENEMNNFFKEFEKEHSVNFSNDDNSISNPML